MIKITDIFNQAHHNEMIDTPMQKKLDLMFKAKQS